MLFPFFIGAYIQLFPACFRLPIIHRVHPNRFINNKFISKNNKFNLTNNKRRGIFSPERRDDYELE